VLEQKLKLEHVPSKEQVVDLFTKPLPCDAFEYLRQKLGMVFASSLNGFFMFKGSNTYVT